MSGDEEEIWGYHSLLRSLCQFRAASFPERNAHVLNHVFRVENFHAYWKDEELELGELSLYNGQLLHFKVSVFYFN